jgi:pimeloyl-ACP methyl ester carboxylesterase
MHRVVHRVCLGVERKTTREDDDLHAPRIDPLPGIGSNPPGVPADLHFENVIHTGATPSSWLYLTHGIYGSGGNWRSVASKVVARRPAWGIVLVDLRGHGRSAAGSPPFTVEACAQDVVALIAAGAPARALAGHSFGGKVMLAARDLISVDQTWMLDSSPSTRPDSSSTAVDDEAVHVLRLLRRLPRTWKSRDEFVRAVVADGFTQPLAQWLAMNVVPAGGGYELRFDLEALQSMLDDFRRIDRWPAALASDRGRLELVVADRGGVFTPADLERLKDPPAHIHVHHVAAGHWLHVEATAAVVDLFVDELPR